MEDDSKLSYFFLGLGLGVAAGVLFAPKSGAETREFLRSKAEEGGADSLRLLAHDDVTSVTSVEELSADAIERHRVVEADSRHSSLLSEDF